MKRLTCVLAVLLACGHLGTGGSGGGDAPESSETEVCTEDLAARRGDSSSGCRCITGGVEGAWGAHWGRPFLGLDGGTDYLHGSERWCPRR